MKKIITVLIILISLVGAPLFIYANQDDFLPEPDSIAYNSSYIRDGFYDDHESTLAINYYLDYLANRQNPNYKINDLYTFVTDEYPGLDSYVFDTVNNYLQAWGGTLNAHYHDTIDYYYINSETGVNLTNNTAINMTEVIDSDKGYDYYYDYIVFSYDSEGHLSINTTQAGSIYTNVYLNGNTKNNIESYIFRDAYETYNEALNYNVNIFRNEIDSSFTMDQEIIAESKITLEPIENSEDIEALGTYFRLKELRNTKIYFGHNIQRTDEKILAAEYPFSSDYRYYQYNIIPYYGMIGLALMTIALLLPIKVVKELPIIRNLKNIKLELWALIATGYFLLLIQAPEITLGFALNETSKIFVDQLKMDVFGAIIVIIIEYGFAMLLLSGGLLLGIMIRYIFHIGIFKYIKNHSYIIKLVSMTKNYVVDRCTDIEGLYSDNVFKKANGVILAYLGLNIIGMIMIIYYMRATGVTSFLFISVIVVIYNVILLLMVIVVIKKANINYQTLKSITGRLAEGELNVKINDDLGIYNEVKEDLLNIKNSFSSAVYEEVKSQRMKTELISNVSHDLKTPLTNIINYTDLLKIAKDDDVKKKEYIDTIERNSKRLKNLIEDLFEVSKLNSGNIELDLQSIDVFNLIKQIYLEWEEKYHERNLDVRFTMNPESIVLKLDSYKSHRIFENLLNNIYKYALENTRVYIDVKEENSKCVIEFKNISATEILFDTYEATDRFVRGDKSRNTEGSGLGLAIAKSLTELHGGKIDIVIDGDLFKAVLTFDLTSTFLNNNENKDMINSTE